MRRHTANKQKQNRNHEIQLSTHRGRRRRKLHPRSHGDGCLGRREVVARINRRDAGNPLQRARTDDIRGAPRTVGRRRRAASFATMMRRSGRRQPKLEHGRRRRGQNTSGSVPRGAQNPTANKQTKNERRKCNPVAATRESQVVPHKLSGEREKNSQRFTSGRRSGVLSAGAAVATKEFPRSNCRDLAPRAPPLPVSEQQGVTARSPSKAAVEGQRGHG